MQITLKDFQKAKGTTNLANYIDVVHLKLTFLTE
jgi:hypothetical protein